METKNIRIEELRALNRKLKSMPSQRDEVYTTLLEIESSIQKPGLQCYWHYLIGKYWEFAWKTTKNVDCLEKANSKYDEIFEVATQYKINIKNCKYFFKRAHCKYLLSKQVDNEDDRDGLIIVSAMIVRFALKQCQNNSSMLWLQKQLKKS